METPHPLLDNLEHEPDDPALAALQHALALASGTFALFIAVCDDLFWRDECLRRLTARLPGTLTIPLTEQTEDPFTTLPPGTTGASGLHLIRLELTTPADATRLTALHSLNLRRGQWKTLACPLILWVPSYLHGLLLRHAPDFADWTSSSFTFSAPKPFQLNRRTHEFGADMARWDRPYLPPSLLWQDAAARKSRRTELLTRLPEIASGSENAASDPISASWCNEIAHLAALDGDDTAALRWHRAAANHWIATHQYTSLTDGRMILATAWQRRQRHALAKDMFDKAWDSLSGIEEPARSSPQWLQNKCILMFQWAASHRALGEDIDADSCLYACVAAGRLLVEQHAADATVFTVLFAAYQDLMKGAVARGDTKAGSDWQEATTHLLDVFAASGNLETTRPRLAARYFQQQGLLAAQKAQYPEAIQSFSRAAGIFQKLAAQEPENHSLKEDWHQSLYAQGNAEQGVGNTLTALQHLNEALAIAETVCAADPGDAAAHWHVYAYHLALAAATHHLSDLSAETTHLQGAFDALHTMKTRGMALGEHESGFYERFTPRFLNSGS